MKILRDKWIYLILLEVIRMTKEEFIRTVQSCGYGTKTGAKKYVELNPKEDYSMNDLIVLHEGNMHWQGVSGDKGLNYAWCANGRTTAFSNGIAGNSGSRQDWNM
jgi:hypothetical protein